MQHISLEVHWRRLAFLFLSLLAIAPLARGEENFPLVTNLLQFHQLGRGRQRVSCALHLQGVVAWASPSSGQFVLQDEGGSECVEMEPPNSALTPGESIVLDGLCSGGGVGSDRHIGPALLVDNNGVHAAIEKSSKVFLTTGKHPVCLTWFTKKIPPALEVWWEGPALPRQKIPNSAWFHPQTNNAGETSLAHGLRWKAYEGDWWQLPEFRYLTPAKSGDAPNIDSALRSRDQLAALKFDGLLDVPADGFYTISTLSEDGSQFWMQGLHVTSIGHTTAPAPRLLALGQTLTDQDESPWCSVDGAVSFVSAGPDFSAELELTASTGHIRVELADSRGLNTQRLRNSRIRVTGVCRAAFSEDGRIVPGSVWTPEAGQVEFLGPISPDANDTVGETSELPTLITVEEIKRLKHNDALRGYPLHVRGVITWSGGSAVVIQDATAGIFVSQVPVVDADGPRTGEYWDIEGESYAQFSPMILARRVTRLGLGTMPEPLRATWDQLINGSLDTQFVEVRGVVTGVQSNALALLTHGGRIQLDLPEMRPEQLLPFKDALVRVRGCLWAVKDETTHLFKIGAVQIHNASINVDQPAPADLFAAPLKHPADLLLFDAQGGALQRVKVAGEIVHARPGEYFLMDGTNGLRFAPKTNPQILPGDLVEVAGFPDLSGPSPALREAIVRKTGSAPLPAPLRLSEETLVTGAHDALLVKAEARLVKAGSDARETTLELQMGARTFNARMDAAPEFAPKLRPGSLLELTGVYVGHGGDRVAGRDIDSFELLLNSPTSVRIIAQPPWWTLRRLLAMVGILLAVLGMAMVWIWLLRRKVEFRTAELRAEILERERAQHQRAVEVERSRIARDLHDDLGASLTEISLLADAGPGSPATMDRASQRFHTIGDKARSMVSALDVIVWLVNPRKDVLPFLVGYIGSYAEEYLSTSGIGCRLKIPMDIPPIHLSADVRHGVFLAVRETLHNVVQHAHASEVAMELCVGPEQLRIHIIDNGQGFDASARQKGNGLSNLRERLAGIGGECEIAAQPEAGTRVSLTLPLPNHRVAL